VPFEALDDLYREVILEHFKEPHNRTPLADADFKADGKNPLCGDEVSVQVKLRDGKIAEICCDAQGCSISQASGSIMTDMVKGKELSEAMGVIQNLQKMMRGEEAPAMEGDIEALAGAKKFPARVKCVTLSWHALEEGLQEWRTNHP